MATKPRGSGAVTKRDKVKSTTGKKTNASSAKSKAGTTGSKSRTKTKKT